MAIGFDNLRVLELAGSSAGAVTAKLLGDLGASVMKLGISGREPMRSEGVPPAPPAHLDLGKHTCSVDLGTHAGQRDLIDWIRWADISIESAAPAPLRPRPETADDEQLIRVLISPLGSTGPLARVRSNEFTDEALAGHLILNGEPHREPISCLGNLSAQQAGLNACIGALAALRARDTLGRGQTIEISHFEGLVAMHHHTITMWTHDRHVQSRRGNRQTGYWHPAGIYPCRDGYIALQIVGQAARDRLLAVADLAEALLDPRFADDLAIARHRDEFDALIQPWLGAHSPQEIASRLQQAHVPAGAVLSPLEVLDDEHLEQRRAFMFVDEFRIPRRPFSISDHAGPSTPKQQDLRAPPATGTHERQPGSGKQTLVEGPLQGIRVLDLGRVWAGPLAGRMLADLGADVISVEAPDARGDRHAPAELAGITHLFPDGEIGKRPWNRVGSINALQRNKRGITLDLRREEARSIFEQLVAHSDVVLENFSPCVMPGLGLGFERLAEINPRIVLTSISGFGTTGPDAEHVAFGPILEARSGATYAMGYRDSGPYRSGTAWPDPIAALHAVVATLAALRDRDADPEVRARRVEVSMLESTLSVFAAHLIQAQRRGADPSRLGNRHPARAPQGVYPCLGDDRWIAISVTTTEEWHALCRILGLDVRLAGLDFEQRHERHDEIDDRIASQTRLEDRIQLSHRLQAAGVIALWLSDARDLCESAPLGDRGFLTGLAHPESGIRLEPGCPIRLSETPTHDRRPAPLLGQHNREVLAELLGLDASTLAGLEARDVLVEAPPA